MSSFQRVIKYCAIAFAVLLAVGIISGIASAVVSVGSIISGRTVFHNEKNSVDFYDNFTDVKSLNIDISTGQLYIKSGETFRVEAENVTDNFQAKVSGNGTLTINENKSNVHFLWFDFNGFNNPDSTITLYIPAGFVAEDADISTGAGKVTIDELSTANLLVSAGAGSIYGSNITADKAKIDGGVGSATFKNVSFRDADFNSGVGNLNFEGELLGNNKIDCGVGSVDLELNGNVNNYRLNIDAGVGSVRVNGEKVKDEFRNNNDAENSIEVDGGVGSVRIDFAD